MDRARRSLVSDGAVVYTPGVSQRRSGATAYDLHDQLGSATKQTGSSASVTATRTYDAFGMLVASTGTPQGPFGFAASSGYQEDGDSGLKLLGHRYYDPSTGRFLTRDPIKDGRNWYAYCEGNPLVATDPEGYDLSFLAGLGGALGGQRPGTPPTTPKPAPDPGPKPPVGVSNPTGGQNQGDPGNYGTASGTIGPVQVSATNTGPTTVVTTGIKVPLPGGNGVGATPPQNHKPGSGTVTGTIPGTGVTISGTAGPHQPTKGSVSIDVDKFLKWLKGRLKPR